MFGDIKCDKLRLIYERGAIEQNTRHKIFDNLKKFFPDCLCSNCAGYILNTFTPTKLSKSCQQKYNLEMPLEQELFVALNKITQNDEISKMIWATEIHLTKDIILNYPVNDYILMLNSLPFSYLKKNLIESNNGEYSLYLTYRHSIETEEKSKFIIKFYNKSTEYVRRHGTNIYKVTGRLTNDEIKMVGSAYNPKTKDLDLSELNWLRVEIEFHESQKMLPILQELHNNDGKLTAYAILKALQNGTFYNTLDKIFSNILKKHLFSTTKNLTEVAEEKNISGIRKLACDLLRKSNKQWIYKQIADDLGLKENYAELEAIIRKVAPDSELFAELKEKLCVSKGGNEMVSTKVVTANIFTLANIHDFLVIYKVQIWDDS